MRRPLKSYILPEYATIDQMAVIAGVDRNTVREHIDAGYVKLYRLPLMEYGKIRISEFLALYSELPGGRRRGRPGAAQKEGGLSLAQIHEGWETKSLRAAGTDLIGSGIIEEHGSP